MTQTSPRQVLLGLFILGQLAFLVLSNLLTGLLRAVPHLPAEPAQVINQIAPRFAEQKGHAWGWANEIDTSLRRWSELTGQNQEWGLFGPIVDRGTGFPALISLQKDLPEMSQVFDAKNGHHWPVQPPGTLLRSDNEPDDIDAYVRVGKCRLRRYEGMLYVDPLPLANETPQETANRITKTVRDVIRDNRELVLAYIRWRVKSSQLAPKQVLLLERFYRIHGPEESPGWDGPFLIPMARWRPPENLDAYDFTEKRFIPLP